jgi:hypothetical protein
MGVAIVWVRIPLTALVTPVTPVMGALKGLELFSGRVEVMEISHDTAMRQMEVPVITVSITMRLLPA